MKKLLSVAALILVAATSQAQHYCVNGSAEGLPDGITLQLVPMSHDQEKPIAEATVSDGHFRFEGDIPSEMNGVGEGICVSITVKDSNGAEYFILEPGTTTITLTAVADSQPTDEVQRYRFDHVSISGSPLTDRLNGYKARRAQLDQLYTAYNERHKDVEEKLIAARNAKDNELVKAIQASDEWKALMADESEFFKTVEETYTAIINENRDTYWGPMMALYLMSYFTKDNKPLFDSFSVEAQQSWYGKKMRDEIMPAGDIGEPAKELTVRDDSGKMLTLKELSQGKRIVLIDFWASWCRPCRNEIPNVKKQYELYKDRGFEVVSISIDKKEDAWRKALKEENLEWPNFRDTEGAADLYKVRSIPAMFLINAETQRVIAFGEDARGESLAEILAAIFAL